MSFGNDAIKLRRQALGRDFLLGTLYDARHDSIVRAGLAFYDSVPENSRSLVEARSFKAKCTTEDSFTSRCDLLDVEPCLRINVILSNFGAYGEFLLRHSESHKSVSAALCRMPENSNGNSVSRRQAPSELADSGSPAKQSGHPRSSGRELGEGLILLLSSLPLRIASRQPGLLERYLVRC
ncbi:uncharacterized protein [Oscarella lobularis]|uniref:uncharacterized protein n=1 Tax=Oscarella lobularis TaxID=121494 RepID=UPI003313B234